MLKFFKHIGSSEIIGWPTVDQAVVSGGNFLIALLLARYIGIDSYGVFVLLWMVVLFFSSLHQAAIIAPLQSVLPKRKDDRSSLLFHSLILNLAFVASSATIIGIGLWLNNLFNLLPTFNYGYELILITTTFLSYDYFRKSFYVMSDVKWAFLLSFISYGFPLISFIYLGGLGILTISDSMLLMALSFGISCLLALPRMSFRAFNWITLVSLGKDYFNFSKWLSFTALLQWFNSHVFVISSSAILGPAAAGGIRICQNIVGVLHIVFLSIENVIPIKAAEKMSESGSQAMLRYLNSFSAKFGIIIAILLTAIFIQSDFIIVLAYGEEYLQYGYLLKGFSLLYLLVFLVIPIKIALRTLERTKSIFFVYVVSAILGALISTPFIIKWDYFGVIAGLITVQLVVLIGYLYSIRKEIKNYANHSFSIR